MSNTYRAKIANFLKFRDELSIQNIRWELWPLLLLLPLAVIMGDLRYFDLEMKIAGFESYEFLLFPLGLGCLVTAFIPKRLIIPVLRIAVVISALLFPMEFLFPDNIHRFPMLMAFHFFNGICEACAFSLFCFKLNNVERLSAMILIQFYFSFLYTICRAFPDVQSAVIKWGGIAVMAIFIAAVFACDNKKHEILSDTDTGSLTRGQSRLTNVLLTDDHLTEGRPEGRLTVGRLTVGQEESGAVFIISLGVIHYIIQSMINYVEWAEESVSSMALGIGSFASIILIIFIQLLNNRSALYSWLLFLVLSLFGLGALMFDLPVTRLSGSFAYGLGEGLGYVIIFYLCGGAIKKSKSLKIFRFYCVVSFVEYFFISGALSIAFDRLELPNHYLAFGIMLVLCSVCFMFMPLIQKKLFETDWTDGLHLKDMAEFVQPLAETEAISDKDNLDLTDREREIFTMLLKRMSPKDIGYILKVSYHTIDFHRRNLYRKLGIQSRSELFALYLPAIGGKPDTTPKNSQIDVI
ncbi:MAG: helix-turn-helix transcriptional regulator [Treponema sp.]|jgi:DNA-binding CsgD family transcriptional regulator|nr:helix-turn-helix transcriptional regulator [Treponema sp.]